MWIVREPGRAAKLGLLGTKANLSRAHGNVALLLLDAHAAHRHGRDAPARVHRGVHLRPRVHRGDREESPRAAGRPPLVRAREARGGGRVVAGAGRGGPRRGARPRRGSGAARVLGGTGRERRSRRAAGGRDRVPPRACGRLDRHAGSRLPAAARVRAPMLALGDVFSHTGWATWFPWSIVPSFIGAIGQPYSTIAPGSLVVAALTFVAGSRPPSRTCAGRTTRSSGRPGAAARADPVSPV